MSEKVLVTYATKKGSTASIAEHIGETLREHGLSVEVVPVEAVKRVTDFRAVVLGSAVYFGQWRKDAAAFLKRHETELTQRPLWLFSSGPTGEGDPVVLMKGWRFPEELQAIADRIGPRDIAFFHGMLDKASLTLMERIAVKAVKAAEGDFRDWSVIGKWGEKIARDLADSENLPKREGPGGNPEDPIRTD